MNRTLLSFAFAALTAVCAVNANAQTTTPRPDRTQPSDTTIQAGTYELAITFGGGLLDATLDIAFVRDSMTAVLKLGDHESPVKAGARKGNMLTLEPKSAAMNVRYELEFTGQNVKGTFIYQGEAGTVTGKRRAAR